MGEYIPFVTEVEHNRIVAMKDERIAALESQVRGGREYYELAQTQGKRIAELEATKETK